MNREALEARQTMLLLGAIDMDHVIAAAEAIQREHESGAPNLSLLRALETAVVVCYWRPFSQSNTLGHLRKSDAHDPALHAQLKTWRDEAHAHTDESSSHVLNAFGGPEIAATASATSSSSTRNGVGPGSGSDRSSEARSSHGSGWSKVETSALSRTRSGSCTCVTRPSRSRAARSRARGRQRDRQRSRLRARAGGTLRSRLRRPPRPARDRGSHLFRWVSSRRARAIV